VQSPEFKPQSHQKKGYFSLSLRLASNSWFSCLTECWNYRYKPYHPALKLFLRTLSISVMSIYVIDQPKNPEKEAGFSLLQLILWGAWLQHLECPKHWLSGVLCPLYHLNWPLPLESCSIFSRTHPAACPLQVSVELWEASLPFSVPLPLGTSPASSTQSPLAPIARSGLGHVSLPSRDVSCLVWPTCVPNSWGCRTFVEGNL
jgi:hypothetical protein